MVQAAEMNRPLIVLVHSPLVGPRTWIPVADALRRRGISVIVPDLGPNEDADEAFWKRHSQAAVRALSDVPADRKIVLVGHSGAGALLPCIGHVVPHHIAAYVFVDAGIPQDGQSHLDNGPFAEYIHDLYAAGGCYPNWTEEDLREIIPDPVQRRRLLADLRPPPLAFWEEPIPVFPGWPNAPCGYLRCTYDEAAMEAQRRGWTFTELRGGHFHMLVDPSTVAGVILDLVAQLGLLDQRRHSG